MEIQHLITRSPDVEAALALALQTEEDQDQLDRTSYALGFTAGVLALSRGIRMGRP